jgi:hypothetical protein
MVHAAFLALVSCSQLAVSDQCFIRAEEAFVIDSLPEPRRMSRIVPQEVYDKILLMGDPCYKCRDRAKDTLITI